MSPELSDHSATRAEVERYLAARHTSITTLARVVSMRPASFRAFLAGGLISDYRATTLRGAMLAAPLGYDNYQTPKTPALPVRHRAGGERPSQHGVIALDDAALARRIAADQARIHGPRRAQLELEQRKYGLPTRGKLPEEMVA